MPRDCGDFRGVRTTGTKAGPRQPKTVFALGCLHTPAASLGGLHSVEIARKSDRRPGGFRGYDASRGPIMRRY